MQTDPVFVLLSGAGAAAVVGLFGAWIQSRREHVRWIREQRLAAYWDLLRIADNHPGGKGTEDEFAAYLGEYQNALARIFLVGTKIARDAAANHFTATGYYGFAVAEDADQARLQRLIDQQIATRTKFLTAVRRELRIRD
jgi:hypothetical protein